MTSLEFCANLLRLLAKKKSADDFYSRISVPGTGQNFQGNFRGVGGFTYVSYYGKTGVGGVQPVGDLTVRNEIDVVDPRCVFFD